MRETMDNFEYQNGALHCEEVSLSRIAEEIGTPTYVYSRDALERALSGLCRSPQGT